MQEEQLDRWADTLEQAGAQLRPIAAPAELASCSREDALQLQARHARLTLQRLGVHRAAGLAEVGAPRLVAPAQVRRRALGRDAAALQQIGVVDQVQRLVDDLFDQQAITDPRETRSVILATLERCPQRKRQGDWPPRRHAISPI